MGFCMTKIENGPELNKRLIELFFDTNEICWVAGRVAKRPDKGDIYHIQGIFVGDDAQRKAVACCIDEEYFVGPLPLNVALPHDETEWVGCYFPLKPEIPLTPERVENDAALPSSPKRSG